VWKWSKIISIIFSVNIACRVLKPVAIPPFIVVWNQFQEFWIALKISFRVNLPRWRFLWIGLDRKEGTPNNQLTPLLNRSTKEVTQFKAANKNSFHITFLSFYYICMTVSKGNKKSQILCYLLIWTYRYIVVVTVNHSKSSCIMHRK
jgi:hypothetical protein